MKTKFFIFTLLIFAAVTVTASAQTVEPGELPKYVVIATTNGGVISDIDVDIRIKKSKFKDGLQRLEDIVKDDSVKTYTDLLNLMDELGFDYLDAFENKIKDGLTSNSKVRQNLVFRKRE